MWDWASDSFPSQNIDLGHQVMGRSCWYTLLRTISNTSVWVEGDDEEQQDNGEWRWRFGDQGLPCWQWGWCLVSVCEWGGGGGGESLSIQNWPYPTTTSTRYTYPPLKPPPNTTQNWETPTMHIVHWDYHLVNTLQWIGVLCDLRLRSPQTQNSESKTILRGVSL